MSYQSPKVLTEGSFPSGPKDLLFINRTIKGQYSRNYPEIPYFGLKKVANLNVPNGPATNVGVGAAGSTVFDPLYGEAIDQSLLGHTIVNATGPDAAGDGYTGNNDDTDKFNNPVNLLGRVYTGNLEASKKIWGFETIRDLVVSFPTTLLDEANVTVRNGDSLEWGGVMYDVAEFTPATRWQNTNVFLYIVCNCETRRTGQ